MMRSDEDTAHYAIYNTRTDVTLEEFLEQCLAIVWPLVRAYIWHDQPFSLRADENCLRGCTRYGENVEDEWFVVALLLRLTERVRGAVARITDHDGEMLLIEAADALPRWAQEPDVASGRVFLFGGKVHLLPLALKPSDLSPFPAPAPIDEARAARTIADEAFKTEADSAVQSAVGDRLRGMPDDWKANLHNAHLRLPVKVARIVHHSPQIVAVVVRRLMDADQKDGKVLRTMSRFPPTEMVSTGAQFTKCLYAQVTSKSLWPYKGSKWTLPPREDEAFDQTLLGFKLAAGMELLAVDAASVGEGSSKGEELFVQRLTSLGYFKNLLPGSKEHSSLLAEARLFFNVAEDEDPALAHFSYCLEHQEDYAQSEEAGRPEKLSRPADGEAWMHHDQESMDKMLEAHFGLNQSEEGLMGKLTGFLEETSDVKGVEHDLKEANEPLELDADALQEAMEKMLRMVGDDQHDDESVDEDEEEDFFEEMEDELLQSNVKDGRELMEAIKNLTSEFAETPTGPAKTLLQSIKK